MMTSEFWQHEYERLAHRLVERCLGGNDRVRFETILEHDFPEIYLYMVKLRAKKVLASEKPFEVHPSERYRFDSVEFREQLTVFRENVLRQTLLTRGEIEEAASGSTKVQAEILVRPRQKLLEMLFAKRELCRTEDALIIVRGFGERRAFVERMVAMLRNQETSQMLKEDLSNLAKRVEVAVYKETPVSSFLMDLILLLQFENACTGEEQALVRSEVLLDMLSARELEMPLKDFREEAKEKDFWTLTEIENSLERHLLVGDIEQMTAEDLVLGRAGDRLLDLGGFKLESRARKPGKKRQEYESLQFNFLDDVELEDDEDSSGSDSDSVDLLSRYQQEPDEYDDNSGGHHPDPENGDGQDRDGEDGEAFQEGPGSTTSEERSSMAPSSEKSTEREADEEDGTDAILVERVFDSNDSDYDDFMRRIERMDDWLEGKDAVEEILQQRQIGPDSEEAVRLRDAVFSKFFTSSPG